MAAKDKDYCIVIPVFIGEKRRTGIGKLVDNCLESIDTEWSRLLLIDNSNCGYLKKYEGRGAKILYHPENLGCARSWNLGIKEGHDWTFIVSQSMQFPDGFHIALDSLNQCINEYIYMTWNAWHCQAISRKLVDKIGIFDENFYPARLEDTDYMRRLQLAQIGFTGYEVTGGKCQMTSSSFVSGIKINSDALNEYYGQKWGSRDPNQAFYTKPFNKYPLDYWPEISLDQAKEKYGL